jgi:NADH-quinone oxidoreductase subunit N
VTISDLFAFFPLIVVGATIVVTMLVIAVRRVHLLTARLTMLGLALSFVSLFVSARFSGRAVTPLFIVDGFGLFLMGLFLAAGFVIALFSFIYFKRGGGQRDEHYLLLLTAVLGTMVLAVSNHFGAFFLGLELLGVSLYGLIAYEASETRGVEAGVKYFVLAALSTALVAFGIALIYADTGALSLSDLGNLAPDADMIALGGLVLVLSGIGFKLAIVPFHLWSPDVYQGAPSPTTAFIATVSKGGVFAFFLRAAILLAIPVAPFFFLTIAVLAVISMFAGNLLALQQQNLKRLLAYSSIAHMGYLLITVVAFQKWALSAAIIYLTVYFLAVLAAFGVLIALSAPGREAETLEQYRGLYWRRPWLAAVLTLSMLSLAGIPLTAGFMGKFILVGGGISSAFWVLIFSLIFSSVIGLYYYLRVIVTMFSPVPADETGSPAPGTMPWSGWLALASLGILLLWIGVYPSPFFGAIETILTSGG